MATERLPHNSYSRIFPEQMGKDRVDVSRLEWQRSGNYCIHLSWKWSLQTHLVLVLPWFLRLRGVQTPVGIWVVAWKMRVHTRLTCGGSVSDGSVAHYKYSHLRAVMWYDVQTHHFSACSSKSPSHQRSPQLWLISVAVPCIFGRKAKYWSWG